MSRLSLHSGKDLKSKDGMDKCVTTEKEPETKNSHNIEQVQTMGKGVETNEEKVPKSSPPLAPKIPFPHRLRKQKDGKQFSKFFEIFKKLQINIPLAEALVQMPKYTKFLKEIITDKCMWDNNETVPLGETCSSIISRKIPTKLKDPGSFTIPCIVGTNKFSRYLCDLGASINLMPLSIFNKLGLGDVKATNMTLQLVDHSIKRPYGVVEDVLVKVDKFIFPVDFVILEFKEDRHCPLILGRPFLNTSRALIDVYEGKLTLRVGDESVEFIMTKLMKYPLDDETFMKIVSLDDCIE